MGKLFLINDYVSIEIHLQAISDYFSRNYFTSRKASDKFHVELLNRLPKFDREIGISDGSAITQGKTKSELFSKKWVHFRLASHLLRYFCLGPQEEKIIYLQGCYDLTRSARKIDIINPYDKTVTHMEYKLSHVYTLLFRMTGTRF